MKIEQYAEEKTATSFVIKSAESQQYIIPLRYRKMENMHIVFWLFKDISWCLIWKVLGVIMIAPTFTISLIIAWRTRQYMSELCHNIAVSVWIAANSYWMISEFFGFDKKIVIAILVLNTLRLYPLYAAL